jgi:hypothetical protein
MSQCNCRNNNAIELNVSSKELDDLEFFDSK